MAKKLMNKIKFIIYCAFAFMFCSQAALALDLEKLVMPGELTRAHESIEGDCGKCHESFNKAAKNKLCLDCHDHANIKKDIANGAGYHGRIKNVENIECKTCHTDHRGREASIINFTAGTFDHKNTDFILKGKHAGLECSGCHLPEKQYHEAPGKCVDCHGEKDPHKGNLGKQCAGCHNAKAWQEIKFDHEKDTDFDLIGKHKEVNCDVCHVSNKYKDTPKKCYACHYVNDIHNGSQGKKCESCHSAKNWKTVRFDHDKETNFPLKWKHADISCIACHVTGSYEDELKTSCVSCHKKDDTHKGQYGNKCSSCHGEKSWKSVSFDHDKDTKFKLTGLHKKLLCNDCHRSKISDLKYKTECYDCHQSSDVHRGEQGEQCNQCHSDEGWSKKLSFDHGLTGFPLMGQHAVVICEECHVDKNYKKAGKECRDCHKNDDAHEGRFGDRCEVCHNPNDWNIWIFDHNKQTDFTLDGVHSDLSCDDCHTRSSSSAIRVSETCEGCHRNDDVHRGEFGQQCQRCHVTSSFRDDIKY